MMTDQATPQAVHEEKTILGIVLMDGIKAMEHCTRLRTEMFSLDSHRRIWAVMQEMIEKNILLDDVALYGELKRRKEGDAVGGLPYILGLTEGIPRHFNPSHHVEMVIEKWKLRQIQRICQAYSTRADEQEMAGDLLAGMQADVMDVIAESDKQDNPLVIAYSIPAYDRFKQQCNMRPDEITGMSYGVADVDSFTEGMQDGEVTVVGARSGVGKSSLMLQSARANARIGIPVHLFSLEMSREQCLRRLWAIESDVPYFKIRKPSLCSEVERQYVKEAVMRIAEWPIRIHDKAELDLSMIAGLARVSIRQNGTKLFCVDYAQNVEAEGRDERTKVSNVSRTMTKIAKDENAHLMLLSQLRKVSPDQYNKAPHVGDLRETGQLENDAHTVLLLHRPWDEENACIAYSGEIIIPKQRNGDTKAIQVTFNKNSVTFE